MIDLKKLIAVSKSEGDLICIKGQKEGHDKTSGIGLRFSILASILNTPISISRQLVEIVIKIIGKLADVSSSINIPTLLET